MNTVDASEGKAPPELATVRPGEELAWNRLDSYLRAALPELRGPMSVLQFPNGAANLTYRVAFGDDHLVVRRPPFGRLAPGAHDMVREHAVLSRLYRAYPRAPRALLVCEDPDVIGATFVVTQYRPGVVVWGCVPETMRDDPTAGYRIGLAVVDALADLHLVDPSTCGLDGFGRPDGFLERQVRGWSRRWDLVAEQPNLDLGRQIGDHLAASIPRQAGHALVHLDFKVDNCQFAPHDPDRVSSVFDWDMATLGDPLVDLGIMLNYWPDPTDNAAMVVPGLENLGLPTRAEVVEAYARRTGCDLGQLPWYEAFACWRTAIVLQQLYARYQRGESSDPRMASRSEPVVSMLERAVAILGRTAAPTVGGSR